MRSQLRGMEWLRQLPRTAAVVSFLSTVFLIQCQVRCLHIRPMQCHNSMGDSGTCMFVWECIKTEGKHLGTCADGFLFGSCCAHNDSKNDIIPSVEAATTTELPLKTSVTSTTKSTTSSTFYSPSTGTLSTSTPRPQNVFTMSSIPYYTKPYIKPPYFKPSTSYNTVFTRPTSKPTSNAISTVIINQPVYPDPVPSSEATTPVIKTTKPSFIRPTTNKYGYSSSTQSWFHPSSFKPLYVSTKQPIFPTNVSTTRRPPVTYWTSKYPYFRPSWKPTAKPTFTPTSPSKPLIFTYLANNSTRPSFTPFTSKASTPSSTSSVSIFNVTSVFVNTTTSSYTPDLTVTKNTLKPVINATQSESPATVSYPSNTPTTPNQRPVALTSIVSSQLFSTTQYNWFHPFIHKSTTASPAILFSTIPEDSSFLANVSLQQESSTTEIPQHSSETTLTPITLTSNDFSQFSLDSETSTSSKTTTPLPVTPCGMPIPHAQKKVVGGKNSAFGSWPWQASVRRTSFFGFSSTHRCGGALISPQWVATAGHCVDDLLLSQIKIRVGEYDFASVQEPHGYVERGVKKKVVHPRYNFFTYENDLALVQLEEPIDSAKHPHISPICLPPSEENLVGRNATVTGWGRLSEGGVLPSILQEVQVPIISNEKCKNMFLAAGRHEYIPDIFMCAGFEEGGRDSCQGDSGGPLQIQTEEGYWFLAGIISWGIGCAEPNMPGVCTRISKFKDWVVQQIT